MSFRSICIHNMRTVEGGSQRQGRDFICSAKVVSIIVQYDWIPMMCILSSWSCSSWSASTCKIGSPSPPSLSASDSVNSGSSDSNIAWILSCLLRPDRWNLTGKPCSQPTWMRLASKVKFITQWNQWFNHQWLLKSSGLFGSMPAALR